MVRLILDSSSGGYPVLIGTNMSRELRDVVTHAPVAVWLAIADPWLLDDAGNDALYSVTMFCWNCVLKAAPTPIWYEALW